MAGEGPPTREGERKEKKILGIGFTLVISKFILLHPCHFQERTQHFLTKMIEHVKANLFILTRDQ